METKNVVRKIYPPNKSKCYCQQRICDCLTVNKINAYKNKYFCVHTNNRRDKNNATIRNNNNKNGNKNENCINSEYHKIEETTLSSTSPSSQCEFVKINCQLTRTSHNYRRRRHQQQQQPKSSYSWNLEKSMKTHWKTDLIQCVECFRYDLFWGVNKESHCMCVVCVCARKTEKEYENEKKIYTCACKNLK